VPLAGSLAVVKSLFEYLTVTVFVALTHAVKLPLATIEPFGTPRLTASPSAAPVTVIVKSDTPPAAVLPKSSVAVAVSVFANV